ncbi:MAG: hypothetical protein MZU91_06410 [Desulfosudis oleivorans]|nr:hypothetical protein [Desulfosudis oleivorans]
MAFEAGVNMNRPCRAFAGGGRIDGGCDSRKGDQAARAAATGSSSRMSDGRLSLPRRQSRPRKAS